MPDTHPLQPGDPVTLGNYRLLGRLGKGAQGVVFKAQGSDGALVAIKLLNTRLDKPGIDGERFMREVAAARRVAQFCTAQVIGASMDGELPYIVSELVDGVSLQRVVQTEGPRSGGALYRLAVGTVTALAAIHRAGIVHRDFKPSNVLLGPDGPRVIDFGIARALDSAMTISSGVVGTPAYMSPEQISGERVQPPSDMFSWALTMTFAATGRPAFGQDSLPAVIYRVMNEEADLSALPDNLRSIVKSCLSKRAEERPTAADTLFALLENQGATPIQHDADIALSTGSQVAAEETPAETSNPFARPDGLPHPPVPQQAMPTPPPSVSGWASPSGGFATPNIPRQQPPIPQQTPYAQQPPPQPRQQHAQHPQYPMNAYQPDERRGKADNDAFFRHAGQEEKRAEERGRRKRAAMVAGALVVALALAATVLFVAPQLFEQKPGPTPQNLAGATTSISPSTSPSPLSASPSPTDTATTPPVEQPVSLPMLGGQDGKSFKGHSKAVQTLSAIKVGGRLMLVSGGQDGVIRVWDAAKHKLVAKLKGHDQEVYAVACIMVGKTPMAVSVGRDNSVRLWNLKTRKAKVLGYHVQSSYAVAVGTVKGKPYAVTGDANGWIKVWDLNKRKQSGKTIRAHRKAINWLGFTHLGSKAIAVSASEDKTLRMWDLGKRKAYGKPYKAHKKGVYSVAFAKVDGKMVAASGGKDNKIRLWNPKTGASIGGPIAGHKDIVYALSFGQYEGKPVLVSGSTDGTIRLWDPETRKPYGKAIKAHKSGVYAVALLTVDGRLDIASAGQDKMVKLWKVDSTTG